MSFTTEDIKKLREQTGAGMMDAKKALEEAGSFDAAVTLLRKKGHASLAKKADRVAKEGVIVSYLHSGKVGVLLELNCETDFVGRNEEFKQLANEIALHIAASAPLYVTREEVPASVVETEKQVYLEQIKDKPDNMKEQILSGKLEKYYEQAVLLEQPYVKDPSITIRGLIDAAVQKFGEKIELVRFERLSVK